MVGDDLTAEPYYAWRQVEAKLGSSTYSWVGKPGLEGWDILNAGVQLLVENALPGKGQRLLDLRCGTGLGGALAAQRGAHVTLCDDSLVAVEAARRTLELYGIEGGQVEHGWADLPEAAFDVAWLNAPRGRAWVRLLVWQAARALGPGGVLYLAGPNQGGIKSYIEDVAALGGQAHVLCIKRRYRLAACTFESALPVFGDGAETHTALCRGQEYQYASAPGVFAHSRLDEGTRVLIEVMQFKPGERFLDLGCGCGLVGLVAASMDGLVHCLDHSAIAVASTRRTMAINQITNAIVLPSDCASATRKVNMQFDVVATNPPFHQGLGVEYEVAQQFIRDASQALSPGGQLYLVANCFIRYDALLSRQFAKVTTSYEDGRFRVIRAVR